MEMSKNRASGLFLPTDRIDQINIYFIRAKNKKNQWMVSVADGEMVELEFFPCAITHSHTYIQIRDSM